MANSVRLLRRYVWLVDTIRRAGRLTLEEINVQWISDRSLRLEKETDFPARTFHRHRLAIADIFGIDISCDRFDGNSYYIENPEALDQPTFTTWLFNGLALDNQLAANQAVARRIIFEPTSDGNAYLPAIIEALSAARTIRLTYRRFGATGASERIVEPYGLKQSNRRWYLLARIPGLTSLTVYALDRIEALTLNEETFTPDPALDIHTYFDSVIGINVDGDYDCEPVALRVYGPQRAYIESRPLHSSQRLSAQTAAYSDYTFRLSPEYEFQRAILAMGPDAEILSPAWLRDEIKSLAATTLARYS